MYSKFLLFPYIRHLVSHIGPADKLNCICNLKYYEIDIGTGDVDNRYNGIFSE